MKGKITYLVFAWAVRILGWFALVYMIVHVAVHRDGLALRGQFARLAIPDERPSALAAILDSYDLQDLAGLQFDPWRSLQISQHYPAWVLLPRPRVLVLDDQPDIGYSAEMGLVFLVFDAAGKLVAAPARIGPDAEFAAPNWHELIHQRDKAYFLLVAQGQLPPKTASRPGIRETRFTAYKLTDQGPYQVFSVICPRQPNSYMRVHRDFDDSSVARLLVSASPPRQVGHVVAKYEWDDSLQTFVGPPNDPQGRWQVIFPTPYPSSQNRNSTTQAAGESSGG